MLFGLTVLDEPGHAHPEVSVGQLVDPRFPLRGGKLSASTQTSGMHLTVHMQQVCAATIAIRWIARGCQGRVPASGRSTRRRRRIPRSRLQTQLSCKSPSRPALRPGAPSPEAAYQVGAVARPHRRRTHTGRMGSLPKRVACDAKSAESIIAGEPAVEECTRAHGGPWCWAQTKSPGMAPLPGSEPRVSTLIL